MENPTPPPAESGEILQEHLTDADRESSAHGPGFRIPSDVDTTDLGPVMVGEYRILGRIASGRNTTIYLGRSFEDRRQAVAVKVLQRDASPARVGRFKRGMVANGLFAHPRVVEVLDGGEAEGGEHYLVTEYHEGRTVRAILKDEGTLRPREALRVARQIVDALGAAHAAGVIHRDVRPKNILLSPDRREARLLDFGIALLSGSKFDDQVFHTLRPGLVGTAKYMSPEQAAGDQLEGSADFYSLGLTLYEMLAGASPFVAGTPMAYVNCHIVDDPKPLSEAAPATKRLPIALHELLDRLLEKDPDERMASAADVAGVIDFVVERLPSA
jgi:serine/threonine-protein kinase